MNSTPLIFSFRTRKGSCFFTLCLPRYVTIDTLSKAQRAHTHTTLSKFVFHAQLFSRHLHVRQYESGDGCVLTFVTAGRHLATLLGVVRDAAGGCRLGGSGGGDDEDGDVTALSCAILSGNWRRQFT